MPFLAALIIAGTPSSVPGAAEAMNFIKEDIKPVIEFAMGDASCSCCHFYPCVCCCL